MATPLSLEKQAVLLLEEGKLEEAFEAFKLAAKVYRKEGNHKGASLCFASAASCWTKKIGEKSFYNAARMYELAAKEALISGDPEYASLLYKYAAINYERDGEYLNFSDCFYRSKEAHRKFLWHIILGSKKLISLEGKDYQPTLKKRIFSLLSWIVNSFFFIIWGYGERPLRVFIVSLCIMIFSSFFYYAGFLYKGSYLVKPTILDAFYFSVGTFTTLGYGDFTPVGWLKILAVLESLSGIFLVPLFIVGLSRRYLRI